jgi:heparin binding hemagglutinin HbhA
MTEQTEQPVKIQPTRIPAPLYAAAGAGDLAYQRLRKLPAVVNELSGKAAAGSVDLRARAVATLRAANTTATSLRDRAATTDFDAERVRAAARRNAAALVAGAQAAQERAVAFYGQLVAHGERVVGTGVVRTADVVNSDIEATEPPAEVTAAPASETEDKPAAKAAKPAKRTRPAAK